MKTRKLLLPEDGYACGLVLKAADFSVHVPLQQQSAPMLYGQSQHSSADAQI